MNAYSTESEIVPPLSINPKDHKKLQENGDPKSRPVCDGSSCQNCRLSNIVCEILTPLVKGASGSEEIESTEELLSMVQRVNKEMQEEGERGEVVAGGGGPNRRGRGSP